MAWAPDYITDTELAAYLRIDDLDDEVVGALAITSSSRAVDEHCNRQFGLVAAPEARRYTARPDFERGFWVVDVDDFQTVTGLVVTVDGVTLTTFDKEPINAAAEGKPWTRLAFTADSEVRPTGALHEVSAVARWGWTNVPAQVPNATKLQASRFFKDRDAPFGVAGSPEMGNELRLLAKLHPDIPVMLKGLVRTRAVG